MQKNNLPYLAIAVALLLTGINLLCHPRGNACHSRESGNLITVHDTIKSSSVQYKIIPGTDYNIDSLITVINQFWKDSLKNMYGKGLFESKFSKTDDLGSRNYTYTSRLPPDPQSSLIIDESFAFPKKTFGLIGSIATNLSASLGLKYYIHDSKHFSFSSFMSAEYLIDKKSWQPCGKLELEYKF
jgi:hypothetical protein